MIEKDQNRRVGPLITVLSEEEIVQIHQYSLKILEKTGIKVESEEALKIFKRSGGVKIEGNIVRMNSELIDFAIEATPSNIRIFNKNGDEAFELGSNQGKETYFGIGVTNPWFQNIEDNSLVPFTRSHMRCSTNMGDMLENFDMISTPGVLSDVDPSVYDFHAVLDMYANTDKPLVILISKEDNINNVFKLLDFLHGGDISEKPFCIPYFNPITPLVLNKSTTDKMAASMDYGLPLMYSNYGLYGGTTPITEAGTLALLNAELLAGLVFGQLYREGSKMILGSLPASFNMSTMGSSYTSATYLLNLACAEMMNYYNIPHCGTSGSSNAWGPDLISSADLWQNHLTSCLGKVGCSPFVGGSFDSMAFSPGNIVLSNEIIGKARTFSSGFEINDKTVNINEINLVSHGGNYFTSEATLERLSQMNRNASIWPSMNKDEWLSAGAPGADKVLRDKTLELYHIAGKRVSENMDTVYRGEDFLKLKKII